VRTIFVTGGAGFIGSALVRSLVRDSDAGVVTIDALTYAGNLDSLREVDGNARHVFVRADVRDAAKLRELFAQYAPIGVFHLAAESHVDRSIDGPGEFVSTNVVGTATLLEAAYDFWCSESVSSEFAVCGEQGGRGPSRARLVSDVRFPRDHVELLEQLRALSVPGKTDSVDDSSGPHGADASRVWHRSKRS
jgi:nucleoside-diphosphate-sugar epimerase